MPARQRLRVRKWKCGAIVLAIVALLNACLVPLVGADGLTPRTVQQLSSTPGVTTDYTVSFTISNNITLGAIRLLICSNDPIEGDLCDLPTGLDLSNAELAAESGITDFTLSDATPNQILLSRPTAGPVTAPQAVSFTLSNIVNPTVPGPYYLRVAAYDSTEGNDTSVAFGGLAFAINNNVQLTSVVPPYLTFCSAVTIPSYSCSSASGSYIDFGGLSSARSDQGSSQLLVATNAAGGYTIQVYGTTMTAGNNVIAALTAPTGSHPGSAQFGINLRANSVPPVGADPAGPGTGQPAAGYDQVNRFQFVSNNVIAGSSGADNYREYTVSYLVNAPSGQSPGVYTSTLTYVAAGSF